MIDMDAMVAVSITRDAYTYHAIDHPGVRCGTRIQNRELSRREAESEGYDPCQHCFGDVNPGPQSGLRETLLKMDPDEVET